MHLYRPFAINHYVDAVNGLVPLLVETFLYRLTQLNQWRGDPSSGFHMPRQRDCHVKPREHVHSAGDYASCTLVKREERPYGMGNSPLDSGPTDANGSYQSRPARQSGGGIIWIFLCHDR